MVPVVSPAPSRDSHGIDCRFSRVDEKRCDAGGPATREMGSRNDLVPDRGDSPHRLCGFRAEALVSHQVELGLKRMEPARPFHAGSDVVRAEALDYFPDRRQVCGSRSEENDFRIRTEEDTPSMRLRCAPVPMAVPTGNTAASHPQPRRAGVPALPWRTEEGRMLRATLLSDSFSQAAGSPASETADVIHKSRDGQSDRSPMPSPGPFVSKETPFHHHSTRQPHSHVFPCGTEPWSDTNPASAP